MQSAELEIKRTVAEYINSLTIGKPAVLSEIIKRIRTLHFSRDVTITSPIGNITIGSNQILRCGNIEIIIKDSNNE